MKGLDMNENVFARAGLFEEILMVDVFKESIVSIGQRLKSLSNHKGLRESIVVT